MPLPAQLARSLIYLDSAALQIPRDIPSDLQQLARRKGVRRLLLACHEKRAVLVWSPALEYENITRIPPERLSYCQSVRALAAHHAEMTADVIARARQFEAEGPLGWYDAQHLAAAESVGAILVTEDKKFRSRASGIAGVRIRVVDVLTAVELLDG